MGFPRILPILMPQDWRDAPDSASEECNGIPPHAVRPRVGCLLARTARSPGRVRAFILPLAPRLPNNGHALPLR